MSDEKKKVVCPDCETENDAELQFCSKCQLDLPAFFTLDRVMSVREKVTKRAEEDRIKKEKESKRARRSGLASLTGRKS